MKRIAVLALFLVLAVVPSVQAQQEPQAKPLVFTHVTVIDATGAPAQPDMTVVITKDRMTTLGQFLIPGLWDMHTHTEDCRGCNRWQAVGERRSPSAAGQC
jgi:cytosine/adenosine deaminase-related metal-dependent hydrolase